MRNAARSLTGLLLAGCVSSGGPPAPSTSLSATRAASLVIQDADGDRFADDRDTCPRSPGIAPNGCPVRDSDGDELLDHIDACPNDAGVKPDGCPLPDTDRDRIPDPSDKCVTVPETNNGYLDADGCADELPADLAAMTGVLHGVSFELHKDSILPGSRPTLDRLVKVLTRYPAIRVEIRGHLDTSGDEYVRRSRPDYRQANAVKNYLVRHGIAEDRLETSGAGLDEPLASNKTAAGRAKNRRIEIRILVQ